MAKQLNLRIIIRLVSFAIDATFLVGCVLIPISAHSGTISIEEPVMSKAIDEESNPFEATSLFKTTDQRIYCTISIRGPEHVRLGARWYHEEKLIFDKVIDVGPQQRGVWWLEMSPGQKFPRGKYHIEIYLIDKPDKTVYFTVEE